MGSHRIIVLATLCLGTWLFRSTSGAAGNDEDLLRSLPAEEQALKDSVDHWGYRSPTSCDDSRPRVTVFGNSIRAKVLRDGLEDYGYLMELQRRAAKSRDETLRRKAESLLAVPPAVIVDTHCFNRNPAVLLDARKEIARLIEALEP